MQGTLHESQHQQREMPDAEVDDTTTDQKRQSSHRCNGNVRLSGECTLLFEASQAKSYWYKK